MAKGAQESNVARIKSYWQIRTLLLLWFTYAAFYLGRFDSHALH